MRWIRLSGLVALALIIVASLMLPAKLQQLRTGHWAAEHFLAYFAATLFVCLGWRRPFVVVGIFMAIAALVEALQGLTPNRIPDLLSAVSGASGVLAAALIANLGLLALAHEQTRAS